MLGDLKFNYSELREVHNQKECDGKDLLDKISYYEKKLDEKNNHIDRVERAFIDLEKNFELKVKDIEVLGDHIKMLTQELGYYKGNQYKNDQEHNRAKINTNTTNFNNAMNVLSQNNMSFNDDTGYNDNYPKDKNYNNKGYRSDENNNEEPKNYTENKKGKNKEIYNDAEGELSGKRVIDLINERKANKKAIDQKIKEKMLIEESDCSVQMN